MLKTAESNTPENTAVLFRNEKRPAAAAPPPPEPSPSQIRLSRHNDRPTVGVRRRSNEGLMDPLVRGFHIGLAPSPL